jgi:hypothetical protein
MTSTEKHREMVTVHLQGADLMGNPPKRSVALVLLLSSGLACDPGDQLWVTLAGPHACSNLLEVALSYPHQELHQGEDLRHRGGQGELIWEVMITTSPTFYFEASLIQHISLSF